MQGDFSRVTFDAGKHFSAVLQQQGRVQLDADTNEQAAILLHYLRTVVTDLIGPAGVPVDPDNPQLGGFHVQPVMSENGKVVADLDVAAGRMYVDGILVENDENTTYWQQPDGYLVPDEQDDQLPDEGQYLVYLRAFERLVTAAEDASIREVALGDHGPDTAARAKVVWQVAALADADGDFPGRGASLEEWLEWLRMRLLRDDYETPHLSAWATRPDDADTNVCDVDPDSRYRGPENQLYRVEIHHGGSAAGATFKWSRENASVVLPIESIDGPTVTLAALGRDGKLGLEVGDMVEVVDDAYTARVAFETEPEPLPKLYQVKELDTVARLVILSGSPAHECGGVGSNPLRHPYLRRWDHELSDSDDGAIALTEDEDYELEDGVFIRFESQIVPLSDDGSDKSSDDGSAVRYRRGDHWLIPARVVTGDVEWPKENGEPLFLPPNGVAYHYAPLALVNATSADPLLDLRPRFAPLTGAENLVAEKASEAEPETQPEPAPRPAKKAPARKTSARKTTRATPDKE
jgi:Family of unknown function (DUF6519)